MPCFLSSSLGHKLHLRLYWEKKIPHYTRACMKHASLCKNTQSDTETPAYPGTHHRHPGGGPRRAQGALICDFPAFARGTHPCWFLPLPSQGYFSNPVPQRPWEGGKAQGAVPPLRSSQGQKSGDAPWLVGFHTLNCLLPLEGSQMGVWTQFLPNPSISRSGASLCDFLPTSVQAAPD